MDATKFHFQVYEQQDFLKVSNTICDENFTMDAKKNNISENMCKKVIKSAPIPPVVNISNGFKKIPSLGICMKYL